MEYSKVKSTDIPISLLLEADPSHKLIESYLPEAFCFAATDDGPVIAACVLKEIGKNTAELFNISVLPEHQKKGIGTELLTFAINQLKHLNVSKVELGTGTFGYQLTYYQRLGFRVSSVEKDYFLDHYSDPIFENGIQHKDRLRLYLEI